MDAILFLVFAAIAVVCAINLVLQRHPISSALSLIGVMGAAGGAVLLLGGEFIAMAQLIVYAGAIMVRSCSSACCSCRHRSKAHRKLWVKIRGAPLLAGLIGVVGYIVHQGYTGTEDRAL